MQIGSQIRHLFSETFDKTLVFAVFDYDRFSKHDQIGEVKVSKKSARLFVGSLMFYFGLGPPLHGGSCSDDRGVEGFAVGESRRSGSCEVNSPEYKSDKSQSHDNCRPETLQSFKALYIAFKVGREGGMDLCAAAWKNVL